MRLLVSCSQCHRQYDVSGQIPGARLHCHCGAEILVAEAHGHDAAVVRCSACGAPREEGAKACHYCGSDFTIHETDLETVCPICLALVSNAARYCHHCGSPIAPTLPLPGTSSLNCPVCGPEKQLRPRSLGSLNTSVLECSICGGLWLDLAVFHHLLDAEARGEGWPLAVPKLSEPERKQRYRPCVICGELMGRRNFGGSSRVILDVCGLHGIWFDAGELAQLLAWMRAGGLRAAQAEFSQLKGAPAALHRPAEDTTARPWRHAPGVLPERDYAREHRFNRHLTRALFRLFS